MYTVPWLTEYLAMLDPIALRLTHYKNVLLSLFEISILTPLATTTTSNIYMSKLCLGWLFELSHFPREIYYDWLSQKFARNSTGRLEYGGGNLKRLPDDLVVVNQNILYACCPYLEQIKVLLSASTRNSSSSGPCVKHITPTTAVGSCEESAYKKLQVCPEIFVPVPDPRLKKFDLVAVGRGIFQQSVGFGEKNNRVYKRTSRFGLRQARLRWACAWFQKAPPGRISGQAEVVDEDRLQKWFWVRSCKGAGVCVNFAFFWASCFRKSWAKFRKILQKPLLPTWKYFSRKNWRE